MQALSEGATTLGTLQLPTAAPPAFLLDAARSGPPGRVPLDRFDNRSVVFRTDFPSSNHLWACGIRSILLVRQDESAPNEDLLHVLRAMQDGGLTLRRVSIERAVPVPYEVPKPRWYRAAWQRVLAAVGLKRAATAGFGRWMHDAPGAG